MKTKIASVVRLFILLATFISFMAFNSSQSNDKTLNSAWQGTWETNNGGRLLLRQSGKKVIGDFFETQILEAIVKGDNLVGTITENGNSHDFEFRLVSDNRFEGEFLQGTKIIKLNAQRTNKAVPPLKAALATWKYYIDKQKTERTATKIPSETRPIFTSAVNYIFVEFMEQTTQNKNPLLPDYPNSQSFRIEKPTSTYTPSGYSNCGTFPEYGSFLPNGLKIQIGTHSVLSLSIQNELHRLSTANNDAYQSIVWDLGTDNQLDWKQLHNGKNLTLEQITNNKNIPNRVGSPYVWTNAVTLRKTYKGSTVYNNGKSKTYPDVYEYYKIYFTVDIQSSCYDKAKVLNLKNFEILKCGDTPCL